MRENTGVNPVSATSASWVNMGDAAMHWCRYLVARERRFMRRVAKRTKPAVSGCPVRRRKMLPALNVWHRPRKAVNRELHALSGNASCLWQRLPRGTSACGDGE